MEKKIYSYDEMIENIKGYTKFDALLSEDEFEEIKEALSGEKNFKFIYLADNCDNNSDFYWNFAYPDVEEERNIEFEKYVETGDEGYIAVIIDWDTNKRYLLEVIDISYGILYEIK